MKLAGIYKITSPSGKCYIGRSVDLNKRKKTYIRCGEDLSKQPLIYRSINKYGWDRMSYELLWSTTDMININEILNEFEYDFIRIYDCLSPNGYNLRSGGNQNTTKRIKKYCLLCNEPFYCRETENQMFCSKSCSGTYTLTDISVQNKIMKGRFKRGIVKPIKQFDMNGMYLSGYPTIMEAAKNITLNVLNIESPSIMKIKTTASSINQSVHNRITSSYGYFWCFEGEENIILEKMEKYTGHNKKKKVLQYDLNGKFLKKYDSICSAANSLSKDEKEKNNIRSGISDVCRDNYHKSYGYVWCFEGNESSIKNKLNKMVDI